MVAQTWPEQGSVYTPPVEANVPALKISVVMPCLNEARTLGSCIRSAQAGIEAAGVAGEVVIADNGSSDGSVAIAEALGARVVHVVEHGYGNALRGGFAAARGQYVVMGDADESYDFGDIPRFLAKLNDGYGLVMGNRFHGGIEPNAMRWSHQYIGNPVLSWLGRRLFRTPVGDFHCGLRAFEKSSIDRIALQTSGMEYASEMVIKASLHGVRIAELPTVLRRDGRDRPPHLRTWSDGWRHLRFMLLYSPRWLFMIPGTFLLCLGLAGSFWLETGSHSIGAVSFDIHTLLVSGVMCLLGYQLIVFATFTKVFAIREGLHPSSTFLTALLNRARLETGLIAGGLMTIGGMTSLAVAIWHWSSTGLGELQPREEMRLVIPAVVLLALGVQTVFASFFLSILGMTPGEVARRAAQPVSVVLLDSQPARVTTGVETAPHL